MANTIEDNDEHEKEVKKQFLKLCQDMNIDDKFRDEAWKSFKQIHRNVTLEGDHMHWLVCALYVTCKKASVSKEDNTTIPLSRILKSANLSLLHFFQKVRKWLDMCPFDKSLNEQIEHLERDFSVASIVFEKYSGIFKDLFVEDWTEQVKRGRNQKRRTISGNDIFAFCWILYIRTKAHYPDISDDLVNSYHLLICCLDMVFSNVAVSKQLKPSLNPNFKGFPEHFLARDFSAGDVPSIIDSLCQLYEGLNIETKIIRRQYLQSFLEDLLKHNHIKGNIGKKADILDSLNYDVNFKYLNESYEKHILKKGDIDERIFVKEDAPSQIGTPTKRLTAFTDVDEKESCLKTMLHRDGLEVDLIVARFLILARSQVKRNLQEYFNKVKGFVPDTPFTGRRWVAEKPTESSDAPGGLSITSAASRLQESVKGLKPSPSENLKAMFQACKENPEQHLKTALNNLSTIFMNEYLKNADLSKQSESDITNKDFAKARLHLALVLFYKILEYFLEAENKKSNADLSILLRQEIFIKCLFACCIEIVLFSYNSFRIFPWILKTFDLKPYHFFKVIELIIRGEDLSRNVIKHLSKVEEQILESLSWKADSPIYDSIKAYGIPKCQEVAADPGIVTPLIFMSPTAVRTNKDGLQQSPLLTLKDRFGTPPGSPARRNLFGSPAKGVSVQTSTTNKQTTAVILPPKSNASPMLSPVRFPIMLTPGSSPVRLFAVAQRGTPPRSGVIRIPLNSPNKNSGKKYGSLGIFFRKLYHMSSLRLKDLCDKLGIGADLHKKIWTCFEHSLLENIDMLQDRHIDQLLMCAVYVMSKVTKEEKSFHDIMKWYRTQPQATSDVYRRVLIKRASERAASPDTDMEQAKTEDDRTTKEEPPGAIEVKKENISEPVLEENVYQDLIQFYNIVYIKKIKDFALKFASNKVTLDAPPLSPLPVTRKQIHSPRKLSRQHQIYISPIKRAVTPRSKLLYCFDTDSPKKLEEINAMIKGGTRRKVILDMDDEVGPSSAKRPLNGLAKRAQELRQEQMNHRPLSNHK